jgi:polysaccharide export outer membrane protein
MDTLNSHDYQAAAQEEFAGVRFNKYRIVVDPMGNINVPLIGEMHAANASAPELEQAVKQALLEFLVQPRVYLRVVSYASYSIYVLGEVRQPGRYEIKKPVSLSEAIALGGGITREGSIERIYVGRSGVTTQRINLCEVWTQDGLDRELILEGEDVVFVARRSLFNLSEIEQISNIVGNMMVMYLIWK